MQAIILSKNLGPSDRDIIQGFTDSAGQDGPKLTGLRFPDGAGRSTIPMHVSGSQVVSGSTTTSFFAMLPCYNSVNGNAGWISYPAVAGGTPTDTYQVAATQKALATTMATTTDTYRLMNGYMRITPISDPTNTAGVIEGGTVRGSCLLSYSGTTPTYSPTDTVGTLINHHDSYAGEALSDGPLIGMKEAPKRYYPVTQGVTIKIPYNETNLRLHQPLWWSLAYGYGVITAAENNPCLYQTNPIAWVSGMLTGTKLLVEFDVNFEVSKNPEQCPIPCFDIPRSMNLNVIGGLLDDPRLNPVIASGHSFKSLLGVIAKVAPKVGSIANKVGDFTGIQGLKTIGTLANSAAGIASKFGDGPVLPGVVNNDAQPPAKKEGFVARVVRNIKSKTKSKKKKKVSNQKK